MTEIVHSEPWVLLVETQPGDSHRRRGLENQDAAFGLCGNDGGGPIVYAAVADGHGSPKSFRSSVGSRRAIDIAREALQSFAAQCNPEQSLSLVKDSATRTLPTTIVRRWREAVTADLESNPVTIAEWERLESDAGTSTRERLERQVANNDPERLVIYGSTLVAALLTETFSLYLQLGDGEILALRDGEAIANSPIDSDPDLIANETTSLCSEDAQRRFRAEFSVRSGGNPPRLILLTTDGYPNSFQSRDGFRQVASDLVAILENEGPESVGKELPQWLQEASAQGSGDDMSVVLIYRAAIPSPAAAPMGTVPQNSEQVAADNAQPGEPEAPRTSVWGRVANVFLTPWNRSDE